MKQLLMALCICGTINLVYGQTQIWKDYDFSKGNYAILGLSVPESDITPLQDSLGSFYVDDLKTLNDFKTEWMFGESSPAFACSFEYIIYLCKDGQILQSDSVSLTCSEIASAKQYFTFDAQKIRRFYKQVKKPVQKDETMASVESGKKYIKSIQSSSEFIMAQEPMWSKYQGEFTFTFSCVDKKKESCFGKENEALKELDAQIRNQYPKENFTLDLAGGATTQLFVKVKCNKSLFDQFNLYPINTTWRNYNLKLTTFWKK